MLKRLILFAVIVAASSAGLGSAVEASPPGQPADWNRFYYYPYVYYPHAFQQPKKYDHMYYRYSPEMQIPVYNKNWYNFYPSEKPYHRGHHFIMDVF